MAVTNLGTGGSALDAQSGSTSGADTNDPLHLAHDGTTDYVYLPGVNGNYLSTPDAAALDITGDIDLRVKVALDDWTPAAEGYLLSKWSSGQQSYILAVTTGGNLCLYWTTNGSTNILRTSTVALGLTDGAVKWVRATLDVDNGASGHDAKFWTSDDGSSWTQLGTTVTTAGTTSIWSGSAPAEVGTVSGGTSSTGGPGKYYRAVVKSGIDGTTVLDVDTSVITSGSATSFTALTGQTVSVNRSSSGRKTVAVTSPCWLFGTDDYLEVADNADLDFDADDSLTVVAVYRVSATRPHDKAIIAKREYSGTTAGWILGSYSNPVSSPYICDGSTAQINAPTVTAPTGSVEVVASVVDRSTNRLTSWLNGVSGIATTTLGGVGSISNSVAMTVGSASGGTACIDMEFLAAAVWRRALTAAEIALVTSYFTSRWP